MITTGSSNYTIHIENGERVFPCHCDNSPHRGVYAMEDWMHHNCDHRDFVQPWSEWPDYIICGQCGAVASVSV